MTASNQYRQNYPINGCTIIPPSTQKIEISGIENLEIIRVVFQVGGLSQAFGVPLKPFQNEFLDPRDVLDSEIDVLYEKMLFNNKLHDRLKMIEEYFLNKIRFKSIDLRFTNTLLHTLHNNSFTWRVNDLAKHIGIGERNFNRLTNSLLGQSPKSILRTFRFNSILYVFQNMPLHEKMIKVAYDHEYTDQSHFIRDFLSLAGISPGDYLRRIHDRDMKIYLADRRYRDFEMMWKRTKDG